MNKHNKTETLINTENKQWVERWGRTDETGEGD